LDSDFYKDRNFLIKATTNILELIRRYSAFYFKKANELSDGPIHTVVSGKLWNHSLNFSRK